MALAKDKTETKNPLNKMKAPESLNGRNGLNGHNGSTNVNSHAPDVEDLSNAAGPEIGSTSIAERAANVDERDEALGRWRMVNSDEIKSIAFSLNPKDVRAHLLPVIMNLKEGAETQAREQANAVFESSHGQFGEHLRQVVHSENNHLSRVDEEREALSARRKDTQETIFDPEPGLAWPRKFAGVVAALQGSLAAGYSIFGFLGLASYALWDAQSWLSASARLIPLLVAPLVAKSALARLAAPLRVRIGWALTGVGVLSLLLFIWVYSATAGAPLDTGNMDSVLANLHRDLRPQILAQALLEFVIGVGLWWGFFLSLSKGSRLRRNPDYELLTNELKRLDAEAEKLRDRVGMHNGALLEWQRSREVVGNKAVTFYTAWRELRRQQEKQAEALWRII